MKTAILAVLGIACASPALADTIGRNAGVAPPPETVVVRTAAAESVPQDGTVTATAATATSGTALFASGSAIVGPLVPQLGRDIRVVLRGTWAGTVQIGTSTAANACASGTINPLTVGGQTWGSFTANANEPVDTPMLAGVVYCATATITSGTLSYTVRQ